MHNFMTLVVVTVLSVTIAVNMQRTSAGVQPEFVVSAETLDPPSSQREANSYKDFRCVRKSCPRGILLLDGDGNHLGCAASSFAGCSGDCFTCDGVEPLTYFCQKLEDATCTVPPVYTIVGCGLKRKHVDGCSTNQGSWPTTPNGCYCDTGTSFIYLFENCVVAECQP